MLVYRTCMFQDQLELTTYNHPILIPQNVPEQFSAILDPFLVRGTMSSQGQLLLRVGKTEIEYNSSFR